MPVTAKSLVLELLSTTGRRPVPVRSLLEAGRLFAIEDNALRVALARLRASGLVESDARGRYRLGPDASAVHRRIVSWPDAESRVRSWSGGWVAVSASGVRGAKARERRRHEQALRLLGFRTIDAGLTLRPDNLTGGVAEVREQLLGLGLDARALVFGMADLDTAADAAARSLWNTGELRQTYNGLTQRLTESSARLAELPLDAAMRESYLLGGEGLRAIVLDPLLPEPMGPVAERRALIAAMRDYDALGRRCWAGWLGGETRLERGPLDIQGLEREGAWVRTDHVPRGGSA